MKTNTLQRVVFAMALAAMIHVPLLAWASSQTAPALTTIATAHRQSAHTSLHAAQASR
jgi:glucan phosphoethanolaminetransferase (alkaline phosphatase superfamily)